MVRRSAATNLGKFAATVEATYLKNDIMSIFEDLTQDGTYSIWILFFQYSNTSIMCSLYSHFFLKKNYSNSYIFSGQILLTDQDSVRLLAVEGCAALGKLLEPQDCVAHILPVIVNFSQVLIISVYLQ